ncbi:hypothetical protein [Flammeovirga kamogawensis]|uniref:Lipoprotein n=1 Tax=Flammeovirga kamogawensis TaxID=373891 RepID=A0ABX8GVD4_9BACT|nr:hypothetical protein [Flammeovirga kamogawensis]MBB6460982.1 hypothetical protein [Flammeovirga kamogawensis]QWG07554.1 hypothetical protein KM029_01050 [Flammeovirga kamogawensis]TRX69366.1 hypothetical protein EO216_14990 [Flammeovirga kamogawensis]
MSYLYRKSSFSKQVLFPLIAILLGACSSIGEQGVFYAEMSNKPELLIKNNQLKVKTYNSIKNSALLIYEVNATFDKEKKVIILKAKQAIGKKNQDVFEIDLPKVVSENINLWKIDWVDPDGKTTTLEIE